MQQAPRLRTLLVIPPAVRRTPMPQPPARPNSTIPLRKLFFKDNSRFLANFSRCSTSLRRCVQKSAGNRRDLIIARPGEENALPWLGQAAVPVSAPQGRRSSFYAQKHRQRFRRINCNRIMNGFLPLSASKQFT